MRMNTPRDVIEVVWRKVQHADASTCLTQRSFNQLRAALLRQLPLKRRDIQPSIPLVDLIPRARRPTLHRDLAAALQTGPLPDLERPAWVLGLGAVVSLTLGCLVARAICQFGSGGFVLVTVLVAACLQTIAWLATSGLCREYPPTIATVGDLARWIMTRQPTPVTNGTLRRWTREQVSARVREIVIEQLDCAAHYEEDARFIQDLGLG
jgi:hypothetical protein